MSLAFIVFYRPIDLRQIHEFDEIILVKPLDQTESRDHPA